MKENDFKRAFGQTDAGFERRITHTLNALQAQEKEKYVKKKLRFTVAAALAAILIIATIGYAASGAGSLLELITRSQSPSPNMLEGVEELVENSVAQRGGETDDAIFTLEEALYDGTGLYLCVVVRSKDDKTLLLPNFATPIDDVGKLDADWINSEESIESWAQEQGYERLICASVDYQGIISDGARLQPDGSLLCLIETSLENGPEQLDVTLNCRTCNFVERNALSYTWDWDAISSAKLTFSIAATGPFARREIAPALNIPEIGAEIESVSLQATKVCVYAEVKWRVTDLNAYLGEDGDDGLWFRFLLEDGTQWNSGILGSGEVRAVDYDAFVARNGRVLEGDEFIMRVDLEAVEELPDFVTLQAYDCWEEKTLGEYRIEFTD